VLAELQQWPSTARTSRTAHGDSQVRLTRPDDRALRSGWAVPKEHVDARLVCRRALGGASDVGQVIERRRRRSTRGCRPPQDNRRVDEDTGIALRKSRPARPMVAPASRASSIVESTWLLCACCERALPSHRRPRRAVLCGLERSKAEDDPTGLKNTHPRWAALSSHPSWR
jgi:hypothetical protein